MNFQNLEYFVAVSRENNITRAAEQLGISQQALSNQIARMEDEMGCRLFNRKHGFELTYAGRALLDSALKILDINKQTELFISDITNNKRGEIKIGIAFTRGQAILPAVIPEFTKKYPLVKISITEESSTHLTERLEHGDIDVVIGFKPFISDSVETYDLMKEKLYLVASKELLKAEFGDDYKKRCDQFNVKQNLKIFEDMPFILYEKGDRIRTIIENAFSKAKIKPNIRLETANSQTAFALAAEGIGLCVIAGLYLKSPYINAGVYNSTLRSKVEILPFPGPESTIAIGFNNNRYLSNITKDFFDITVENFNSQK